MVWGARLEGGGVRKFTKMSASPLTSGEKWCKLKVMLLCFFEAKNMPSDIAWQLLRLYQAMQFSTARTDIKKRPCAGASKNVIVSSDGKSYSLKLGINSSIATHYTLNGSVYKRQISLYNTYDGSNIEEGVITFDCGVATFNSNDQEISLWTSEQELVANEFTSTDSNGVAYSPYFSNQLITCEDNVEEINLVLA